MRSFKGRQNKLEALKKNKNDNKNDHTEKNRIATNTYNTIRKTEEIKRIDYTVLRKIQGNN